MASSGKVSDAQGAQKAAGQLEAYFLRRVLSEVKTSENSLMGGGFAGDTFKDMFDEAFSDAMAKAGGVGIAKVIAKQLETAQPKGAKAAEKPEIKSLEPQPIHLDQHPVSRPIPLSKLNSHPVSQLVTDPLGNRTNMPQTPETQGIPGATSIGPSGSVSLRRYRANQTPDPDPSSLNSPGRPTDRR